MAVELGSEFKHYKLVHKYTNEQLKSTKELILDIAKRFGFDARAGLPDVIRKQGIQKAFDIHVDAQVGRPGIWTHVNVLNSKSDCTPQQDLIDMLLSL